MNSTKYNGDNGDISPVDIGHEMDPMMAKRGRERKGLIKGLNGSRQLVRKRDIHGTYRT